MPAPRIIQIKMFEHTNLERTIKAKERILNIYLLNIGKIQEDICFSQLNSNAERLFLHNRH